MRGVHVRWADTDAHALLRAVVAELAGARPSEVEVRHRCRICGGEAHGRPSVLVGGRPGPHVSLARAGPRSIVAIAGSEVGIDLEQAADTDTTVAARLAAVVLSDRERAALVAIDPHQRAAALLRVWVRKEALLKALGYGLTVDPRRVELSIEGPQPALLSWGGPGRRPRVRLLDVDAGPGVVATLARVGRGQVRVDRESGGLTG